MSPTLTDPNERHYSSMVTTPPHVLRKAANGNGKNMFDEIGTTGLRQYGGFVVEEWLNDLAGRRAAWAWREMMDNSPVVGAILFAIKWLARGVDYRVEAGKDKKAASFVEECMHDMSHTWGEVVSEALSMLGYGWAYHELVYKKRQGAQPERPWRGAQDQGITSVNWSGTAGMMQDTQEDDSHVPSSQYKDGKIGWRKIPVRAQETLLRWQFDGYSGIRAMEQVDWHGGMHTIPIEKALLFRTQTTRNNPEGRSILRNAYVPYYRLKGIETTEAIGIERDLAGIPIATPPEGVDLFAPGNASLLAEVTKIVTSIRRDEYEGIVLPTAGWTLELLSTGGTRQINTDPVIRRYEQRIATSMLADFVLIGQDAIGSYAMVDVKSDLFGVALDAIIDLVCEVFNRYAIPRLLKLNGMDATEPPEIHHGSAGRIDLDKVGQFLYNLSSAGAVIPWSAELLQSLFLSAGLPANFQDSSTDLPVMPVQPPAQPAKPAAPANGAPTNGSGDARRAVQQPVAVVAKEDEPPLAVEKADKVVHVAPVLYDRQKVLARQLEQEMHGALVELGDKAASAYMTHAGKVLKAQTRRQEMQRLVNRVLGALNVKQWIQTRLLPLLRNHAGRTMADTQRVIQTEIDAEVQIGEGDANKITAAAGKDLRTVDIEKQVRASIMQAIQDGLAAGDNPITTASRIKSLVPAGRFVNAGPGYRSRLIARNETANAQRAAALSTYKSMSNVSAVRISDGVLADSDETCRARNGRIVPIEAADTVQPLHPQCVLEGTVVEPIGELSAVTRAAWSGRAVRLTTAQGNRLTVGPNHPVLTTRGWVKAKALGEGDHVVRCTPSGSDLDVSVLDRACASNVNDAPAKVEQVFQALSELGCATRLVSTPDDLHGDESGIEGEIEIVWADRDLASVSAASDVEQLGEHILVGAGVADAPLSSLSGVDLLLVGDGSATSSSVCGVGGSGPHGDVALVERATHGDVAQPPALVDFSESDTGGIGRSHLVRNVAADVAECARLLSCSQHSSFEQQLAHDALVASDVAGELCRRFPSLVTLDEIVDLSLVEVSGAHVYDLSTSSHAYVADGLIVHNCTLSFEPVVT